MVLSTTSALYVRQSNPTRKYYSNPFFPVVIMAEVRLCSNFFYKMLEIDRSYGYGYLDR